jgi:hypothetical protein
VVLAPALAPVPWILSTSYGFDGFSVQFRGWAGIRYAVEWSEDLDHWVGLQTVLSANGATEFIDPAARGRSKSFYRVRAEGGQY